MLRKLFRFFLIFLQAVIVILLLAGGGFLWRLHRGPINIDKAIPYIIQIAASSDETETDMSIESAELRWGGFRHPVDLSIRDFKAFDDQHRLIASVPRLSYSFSLLALLRGTIVTRTLVIYRPYLNLMLNKTGEIQQNTQTEDPSVSLDSLIETLKQEKHLVEFSLIKAKIKITDVSHNAVLNIPEADLTYTKRFRRNKLDCSVKVDLGNDQFQSLRIQGRWKRKSKKIPLTVKTENLNFSRLPPAEKYPLLKNIETPIDLGIDILLDPIPLKSASLAYLRKAINQIGFTVTGGEGVINLPDPIIARYDMKSFTIGGKMHSSADGFDLSKIDLTMQNGATAQGDMNVSGIGHAIDSGDWSKITARLNAKAQNVPVAMLASYWPASLGPDVHGWVKANIRGGTIDSADFALNFKGLSNEAGIDVDAVDGTIDITGTQVVYLDGMPPVDDVSGKIHLTQNDLVVTIKQASSHGVTAQSGGTFSILGMTEPVTTAALNINVTGKVPDILDILDSPALGFMSAIGIDPKKTTGTGKGNLQMTFPLGDALKSANQIDVKVDAEVRNADVEDIILGMGLQDAILTVKMNDGKLSLAGTALFYGASAKYTLDQFFDQTKDVTTDIRLHVDLNDKAREHLNYPFSTTPAVSGPTPTDIGLILKKDNSGVLNISADLTDAEIDLREIGWKKPAKIGGKGTFTLNMANGMPTAAPLISLTDDQGASVKANLIFSKGKLKKVNVSSVKTPRTNASATVDFSGDDTITVGLKGAELDIAGLLKKGTSLNTREEKKSDGNSVPLRLNLNASIDRLWLSEQGYAGQNIMTARYDDGWKNVTSESLFGEKQIPVRFSLKPTGEENKYNLSLTSDDAGYVLKMLDYTSTVKDGTLNIGGTYTVGEGVNGSLEMSKFYLENSQTLVRILQLTSFTGIIDTLRGEGLFFDKAEIPFVSNDDGVNIDSAVVSGSSLGITLNGKYYRKTGYMNLYGSVIPFYTVNSFLGKIPLIGGLFAGEKGGGLIAPTYTVKGKMPSPDISVNGFSALAPGAIRSVLGKITRDDGDPNETEKNNENAPNDADAAKSEFKEIDPSAQTEIKDEELHREQKTERVLEP